MEIELSPHLLSLTKKEYQSDYIDDRDRVIDELKKDYDEYKNTIDKIFEKSKHRVTDLFEYFGLDLSGVLIFIPKSFVIYSSQGYFHKGLKCDIVIKNPVLGDLNVKKSKAIFDTLYPASNDLFVKLVRGGNGFYKIKGEFDKFKKFIGMGDYGLVINEITFEYDE